MTDPDDTNADLSAPDVLSDAQRFARAHGATVASYLKPGERVDGFGHGGSESLTIFIAGARGERIVRKVLSERLVTPQWSRDGRDVMLPPCVKARRQTDYLRGLPHAARPYFPAVLDVSERTVASEREPGVEHHEFIYDMTYVPGIEISRFVAKHRPHPRVVALLYTEIFRLLRDKVHAHRRRVPRAPTLEPSYFAKIEKRLELAHQTAPRTFSRALLDAEHIVVNGRRLKNVPAILRTYREREAWLRLLEPRFHTLVVGDTNTENIKIGNIEPLLRRYEDIPFTRPPFTAEDLELRFLDPRAIGFHEEGADTGADDPMYDNKPWHNSLGNYDQIHGEHFDLELRTIDGTPSLRVAFHEYNPYARSYRGIGRYFAEAMTAAWRLDEADAEIHQVDPYWVIRFAFLMGTHFMAMPPFHFSRNAEGVLVDDAAHQRRPLAIYVEGIKWLNLAIETLEGRVENFLGIAVPSVQPRTERHARVA